MTKILLLNGPNLNLLGQREPGHYGADTLKDIENRLKKSAKEAGYHLESFQNNAEFELINKIHATLDDNTQFILFNPAAFTHTSIALRDALLGINVPFIEIHISNVHQREAFRQHSYFSDIAVGTIVGLGSQGYDLALQAAINMLSSQTKGNR